MVAMRDCERTPGPLSPRLACGDSGYRKGVYHRDDVESFVVVLVRHFPSLVVAETALVVPLLNADAVQLAA
jgi:hypothetical protein